MTAPYQGVTVLDRPDPRAAAAAPARGRGRGATIWFTGLPSSGKTTLANALAELLGGAGHRIEVLDGDELRAYLTADLGFSRADRDENVRRIGYVARLLAGHGVTVLVPVIAPYADAREAVRKQHEAAGTRYAEVHVATPVDVCASRDVKGLYAKQAAGRMSGLTGVDDPYEPPRAPDIRIDTTRSSVWGTASALYAAMIERGLA